jgi:HD-GYP domain-containing protein (c-di-GMP phosphodiesterase class II)
MHDIGKTAVPVEIINKPSRLDEDEFNIIKNHPAAGYEYLKNANIGDEKMWLGVVCHHEKVDGSGYPLGLDGNEIPIWSRIISAADVYDALTSTRPYRTPMQPAEALEYIMGGIGSSFDYDVVSSFAKKVELYPVGSYVQLSNGVIAIVLDSKNATRPVIRNLETGDVYDLQSDRQLLSVVISRVISDNQFKNLVAFVS